MSFARPINTLTRTIGNVLFDGSPKNNVLRSFERPEDNEWANKIGLSIFAELNALNSEEQCKRWLANHGTKWLARIKELQASYVAEPANSPRYMVFAALNGTLSSLLRDLNQTRATQLTLE